MRERAAEVARGLIADGVSEADAWEYVHRYFREAKVSTEEARVGHELRLTTRLIERRDSNVVRLAELVRERMPGGSTTSIHSEVARIARLSQATVERLLADHRVNRDGGAE